MSTPISTDTLLDRNKAYLPSHQPLPTFAQLATMNVPPPVMVVTCADPRCIPENFLGLQTGEVIVIRNVGGNVEMALPNVLALDEFVGGLAEIMVVKHTDCGSLAFTNEGVKSALKVRAPDREAEIEKMNIGSIAGKTLEQGLKEQIGAVKANVLVREDLKPKIRAFIYDISKGDVREVQV